MAKEYTKEYLSIHHWLNYYHGKATKCENELCKSVSPKRFEWALLKGKDYKKNRNNFIQLCPSCHRKYDFSESIRKKLSDAKKGKAAPNRKPVYQYSLSGEFIASYESYSAAAIAVGGDFSAFRALRNGRLKTYKKFTWKFEN